MSGDMSVSNLALEDFYSGGSSRPSQLLLCHSSIFCSAWFCVQHPYPCPSYLLLWYLLFCLVLCSTPLPLSLISSTLVSSALPGSVFNTPTPVPHIFYSGIFCSAWFCVQHPYPCPSYLLLWYLLLCLVLCSTPLPLSLISSTLVSSVLPGSVFNTPTPVPHIFYSGIFCSAWFCVQHPYPCPSYLLLWYLLLCLVLCSTPLPLSLISSTLVSSALPGSVFNTPTPHIFYSGIFCSAWFCVQHPYPCPSYLLLCLVLCSRPLPLPPGRSPGYRFPRCWSCRSPSRVCA